MTPQALRAILFLVDQGISALKALQAVKTAANSAKAQGRDLTLDDLKQFELTDENARDFLVQAIEEAEEEA